MVWLCSCACFGCTCCGDDVVRAAYVAPCCTCRMDTQP
jgi:hypothetical protein